MAVAQSPQPAQQTGSPAALSEDSAALSANLLGETMFSDDSRLTGLVTGDDGFERFEDLLPPSQGFSPVMLAAHTSVDRKLGAHLADFTLAEFQALQTQMTLRQRQLLTTSNPDDLFAELQPSHREQHSVDVEEPPAGSASANYPADSSDAPPVDQLSLLEFAQIQQENSNLADTVAIRTTADLVKTLQQPECLLEIPDRKQGKTTLSAAITYVATALRLTNATVDKRLTAAASIWPSMEYRRSGVKTPRLAIQLERGRIQFESAIAAQDKLTKIRQAIRRAGGDEEMADELVQHQEREFVRHASRNNSHTFGRFAKSQSDAITNALIGPARTLTPEQIKHEKGVFYNGPVGDCLHKLTLVVDEGEFLQLTAMREFATKLSSMTSTLRAQTHAKDPKGTTPADGSADDSSFEQVHSHGPRLTPEDIEFGIGKLFDGQSRAERWLNTLFDFVSAGLILHKTYDPHATDEEQHRRDTALQKAAEHSDVLTDILGVRNGTDSAADVQTSDPPTDQEQSATSNDPLDSLVPPGYQLLRPNLDLIVEISLQDLLGGPPDRSALLASDIPRRDVSELHNILERHKRNELGITVPIGSPGHVKIDYSLARQQACQQRIIPMVLGTASQPLDVGRAQRSFSPAIRRALHVRDRGCIVPGCHRPAAWCEPHHLQPWAQGGESSLENAALLCRQHHNSVHKDLLQIHMESDGLPSCSLPLDQDPTQTRYRNIFWRAA